jgi:predicted dehydrogenase
MTHRRDFLKGTAAAGIGFFVSAGVAPRVRAQSANEEINFGCIGIAGSRGGNDSGDANRSGKVVAICDIDDQYIQKGLRKFTKTTPKVYHDFRKMLDENEKTIDAVTITTPDHVHGVAASMAMQMGMHCFCQKPLTRTIYEARRLGEIAEEKNVVTQMGNQGTAKTGLREAAALLRKGVLGTVKEVHVWTNRPIWAQGGERPPAKEIPTGLHWEEWLGPAPHRPYGDGYHPFSWRGWWDFGSGALGDMACHTVNMPFMGLDLSDPTSVEATSSGTNKDSYPKWSVIHFEFPANDWRPAIKFVWYDGGKKPTQDILEGSGQPMDKSGCVILGTKAKMYSRGDYGDRYVIYPDVERPDVEFPRSPGHFEEFVAGIKGGPQPMSNFANYAGKLTETILLGNLAVWADTRVEWDAKNLKVTNITGDLAEELKLIVKPNYREGYSV